jgi:hypothetical protein
VLRDRPALPDLAEALVIRDADVVEVDLVELGLPGDLSERSHLDPGRAHVADEERQAAVLRLCRVGAGYQDRPGRVVGQRGPHLLAVDQPACGVRARAGGDVCEIGACAGLAEQLAPDLLAGPQRPHPALLLLGRTEPQQGGRGHSETDDIRVRLVVRSTGQGQGVLDTGLQTGVGAQTAESLREVHPRQPRVEPGPQER